MKIVSVYILKTLLCNFKFAFLTINLYFSFLNIAGSIDMDVNGLKNLVMESKINIANVEGIRSNIANSTAFVVRVSTMKQGNF